VGLRPLAKVAKHDFANQPKVEPVGVTAPKLDWSSQQKRMPD
jgi:hypothetical protein